MGRPEGGTVLAYEDALERYRDVEAAVRRFRWFGVAFLLAQIGFLYSPPPGIEIPFPRWPVALAFAAVLTVTNLDSARRRHDDDLGRLRRAGRRQVMVDTGLAAALIIVFAFDPDARLWPLFVLPVLEAAMRERMLGAVVTAAACATADTLISAMLLDWPLAEHVATTGFRAGILTTVAVGAGGLASRFESARVLAERHASRLRGLADLAQAITVPRSPAAVIDHVLEAAMSVAGALRAELHLERDGELSLVGALGSPVGDRPSLLGALASADHGTDARVTIRHEDADLHVLSLPLHAGEEDVGVLVVATENAPPDREIAELLAAHAAVALEGARVVDAQARAHRELQELDELRSEFVHLLAHELGQPLMGLRGYADLLAGHWERLSEEDRQESLRTISRVARRLGRLVHDVDAIVASDARDLSFDPRPVELAEVISSVHTAIDPGEAHRLRTWVEPGTPPVLADPDRLDQVLANLLSNAAKYADQGIIEVRATPLIPADPAALPAVEITVRDEGDGIPEEQRERIFERHTRLETSAHRPGRGFGLYLTRRLVEGMDGTIDVEDHGRRGSSFRFTLPAAVDGADGGRSGATDVPDAPRIQA
jgi:signal transduction histidine kinase